MAMFDCDLPQWLCDIETFILVDVCPLPTFMNGYVTLWCRSNVMSHCHIHKGFCHISTFIEGNDTLNLVDFGWAWLGIVYYGFVWCLIVVGQGWFNNIINSYVTLQSLSKVMLYCDIHKGFCGIPTFFLVYVGLRHLNMVMSHYVRDLEYD
jgi:hypothetical protein